MRIAQKLAAHDPAYARQVWPMDRDYIRGNLGMMPRRFRGFASSRYVFKYLDQGRAAANTDLRHVSGKFKAGALSLAADDDELRQAAKRRARECGGLVARYGLFAARDYAERLGIDPPDADKYQERGQVARLSCENWWRRRIRKKQVRDIEAAARDLGLVCRARGLYASDEAVHRRQQQKSRNAQIIDRMVAIAEGEEVDLSELVKGSVSNPEVRRAELMVRMRGFEDEAKRLGHVSEFYTITCPSRFHARHHNGSANKNYDESTPRQAQDYLSKTWARIRACLHRNDVQVYGFRVAEPHHDGTPHWHMLLFMAPSDAEFVRSTLRRYALQDTPNEPGAQKYRFEAVRINPGRGSATGYIAKYIAKNIDGYEVGADFEAEGGQDAAQTAGRVDAWASTWGIRQFQQIGGHSVSVWRELRRLREAVKGFENIRAAADAGQWDLFTRYMGGPTAKRKDAAVKLFKVWSDKLGRYLEPAGDIVKGVIHAGRVEITRLVEWVLDFKGAISAPWSSVNNCTGEEIGSDQKSERKGRTGAERSAFEQGGACPGCC